MSALADPAARSPQIQVTAGNSPHGRMPMTASCFYVVGAFDRFNYGDVLFAHLSAQFIRSRWPDAAIHFHSTYSADLRPVGGVKTENLRQLFAKHPGDGDVVWVAGGDVLVTPWYMMAEHRLPSFAARILNRARRRLLGPERMNRLVQWHAGVPNRVPWVFDPETFQGGRPRVVYLATGGQGVGRYPSNDTAWQARALRRASWLSLRDSCSLESVTALTGMSARLMPDSAVLMTDLAEATAEARAARLVALAPRIGSAWNPGQPYLCLQCGLPYIAGQEDILAAQIAAVHDRFGLPVVTFAIGRATGHEDQVAARRLHARLGARPWLYHAPDDLDIWQIMALIAGSVGYMGTSLHGFITAFTFDVPRVGLSPEVKKLRGFAEDWDLPGMPAGVEMANLADAVGRALGYDRVALHVRAEAVRTLAREEIAALGNVLDPDRVGR